MGDGMEWDGMGWDGREGYGFSHLLFLRSFFPFALSAAQFPFFGTGERRTADGRRTGGGQQSRWRGVGKQEGACRQQGIHFIAVYLCANLSVPIHIWGLIGLDGL